MKNLILVILSLHVFGCTKAPRGNIDSNLASSSQFFAAKGVDRTIFFQADFITDFTSLEDFQSDDYNRDSVRYGIKKTLTYLFGPLTVRTYGSPLKGEAADILFDQAREENGHVVVPYHYLGKWLMNKNFEHTYRLELPLPYNVGLLRTTDWKKCVDSEPAHQNWGFNWYFWDPTRSGCDHILGTHYQNVNVQLVDDQENTKTTYPSYNKMIRVIDGVPTLKMTFAFGYISEPGTVNPFKDEDNGMKEFRKFINHVTALTGSNFKRVGILQSTYKQNIGENNVNIGTRFTGYKNGVKVQITVIAAAGVAGMKLMAKSFAEEHEGLYAWFGHSLVGSYQEANEFQYIVDGNPQKYSITPEYQLIYWAGCNSYSFYTTPFFQMKSALNPFKDLSGTRGLDIISNGLPSYFSLNKLNAEIMLHAMWNWEKPTSYQTLITELETVAITKSPLVLINVQGDEDNDL